MSIQKNQLFNRRISGISDSLYLMFIAILTIGGTIYIYQDMSSLTNSSEATTAVKNNASETTIPVKESALATPEKVSDETSNAQATTPKTKVAPVAKVIESKPIIESVTEAVNEMANTIADVAPIAIEKTTPTTNITETPPTDNTQVVKPNETTTATTSTVTNTDSKSSEASAKSSNAPVTVFAPAQQMANMMPQDMQQNMQQNYDHMRNQMPSPVSQQMPEQVQQDHTSMNMPYPAHPPMHNQYSQDQAYGMPYNMNDMQQQYQANMQEQYNHMQQQTQDQGYPQAPNFDRPQIHYQNNAPYGGQFPPQGMPQPWNGRYNN